jgi:tetratricopeptide (TPR) repeat protein
LRHPAQALPLIYGQGPVNRRVSMRTTLSRILWMQGRPDEAEALICEGIALADADAPSTLCQALALAGIPIAFWRGDLDAAMRRTEDLLEYSHRYTFNRWYRLGLCYQQSLNDRATLPGHDSQGHVATVPASTLQREILVTISNRWLDASTMRRASQRLCGWNNAELLRVCGERVEHSGDRGALEKAEGYYQSAVEIARQQQALGWELRAVISLAQLWRQQGRSTESYQCLKSVYERFTEGHATADLAKARSILTDIESAPASASSVQ